MSKEVLAIPEEHLQEFVDLLLFSINNYPKISEEVRVALLDWCKDEQYYLENVSDE